MNRFVNNSGKAYLKGLFFETSIDKATVVYTLKDRDHEGYKSLYLLYMDCDDPTEYEFANTYLNNWKHWQDLASSDWFKPYVARWREELSLRTRAIALRRLKSIAADPDNKNSFVSNKYLLDAKYTKEPVGRPSKDSIRQEAERLFEHESALLDDYQRLNS